MYRNPIWKIRHPTCILDGNAIFEQFAGKLWVYRRRHAVVTKANHLEISGRFTTMDT